MLFFDKFGLNLVCANFISVNILLKFLSSLSRISRERGKIQDKEVSRNACFQMRPIKEKQKVRHFKLSIKRKILV